VSNGESDLTTRDVQSKHPPMPPGHDRRPKVGVVRAFTGHYESVRVLHRFLHHAGLEVITSQVSTAPIIEAGTALASADFCLPLRVYVGHVYTLSREHPDLDAILAPNVWTDKGGSATCSKYRDIGGVAIRSLGGMIPYLQGLRAQDGHSLPRLIRPNIESVTYRSLCNVAFDVYAEIIGLSLWSRAGMFLPEDLRRRWTPHLAHVETAFARAWHEVMERPVDRLGALLADDARPRLAVVGRRYLLDDPALTADLKPWFRRRGATVLTAADVPWEQLAGLYRQAEGFYDSHREGQAFIDWAADKVDGFITLGSFGCHPDAFQVDYLADYARAKGKPAWTFRFDETVGTAGFQTRFETLYGFLEGQRDRRLSRKENTPPDNPVTIPPDRKADGRAQSPLRPLFVWPYMGEELNLLLEEVFVQLGLQDYACPPKPIDGTTLELGGRRYAETCSPFACATGSLMQGVQAAVRDLRDEARRSGRPPQPRRILALMIQGEGPCTFGWYAIAQNRHLPSDLAADLTDGHTLELLTMGLSDPADFFRQLGQLGDTRRLDPVVRYVEARVTGDWSRLPRLARLNLQFRLQLALRSLLAPVWAKLAAAEVVRARSLLVRAHELAPGSTAAAYRECLELLRGAHSRTAIRHTRDRCMAKLAAVPQDRTQKPRVVAVGEIYVALTSFANRGVIEKLLGRDGIEVVEGTTLSAFIHRSLWEVRRRSLANHPWIRPVRDRLEARNIHWLRQRPYDLRARPFLEWEVGGDGMPGVGAARALVEQGCDGIIHIYPFKCMPEGIAKDAYKELSDLYGVRYLGLSFDKELDIERVKTEVGTFAALLQNQVSTRQGWMNRLRLARRRRALGRKVERLYHKAKGDASRSEA